MGMAASQARFLGLTARKSNVEYQVQQINQQRTSLANESAGLYNQMMELEVPTPPSVNSFMKTVYVLDNTNSYANENYTIANMSKTYANNGEYMVTLQTKETQKLARDYSFVYKGAKILPVVDGKHTTEITMTPKDSSKQFTLTCIQGIDEQGNPNGTIGTAFNAEGKMEAITPYQIYALPADANQCAAIDGYEECSKYENNAVAYYYQDANGLNHFLTKEDLFGQEIKDENGLVTGYKNGLHSNDENITEDDKYNFSSMYEYKKDTTLQVRASLEESNNGRLTSISIAKDDSYPEDLSGTTFALSATTVKDEVGYEQAMNDYEYEKGLYEKAISDINSKTKEIQAKDQSLELKIQQLDTEQNAINTEMDSVTKIIEDNIDKTFNVFG